MFCIGAAPSQITCLAGLHNDTPVFQRIRPGRPHNDSRPRFNDTPLVIITVMITLAISILIVSIIIATVIFVVIVNITFIIKIISSSSVAFAVYMS